MPGRGLLRILYGTSPQKKGITFSNQGRTKGEAVPKNLRTLRQLALYMKNRVSLLSANMRAERNSSFIYLNQ
ncbi:hypothetical protein D7322_16180 [Sphingobacterium puteale]|uniref:Uncharacterized protein n=1 Tax=Sphingobacterium puteale TaxID=2420510 RepID=A0A420VW27_9SPHI|nr:hypothetical protein D7322_16180 [Sphingobacterium puteale]